MHIVTFQTIIPSSDAHFHKKKNIGFHPSIAPGLRGEGKLMRAGLGIERHSHAPALGLLSPLSIAGAEERRKAEASLKLRRA